MYIRSYADIIDRKRSTSIRNFARSSRSFDDSTVTVLWTQRATDHAYTQTDPVYAVSLIKR